MPEAGTALWRWPETRETVAGIPGGWQRPTGTGCGYPISQRAATMISDHSVTLTTVMHMIA
jgi:hypothetical protein